MGADDLFLVLQRADQPPDVVQIARDGGELNFAFGTPGHRAGLWKVIVNKKGDIYLMERSLGHLLKLSLHESGDWRWHFLHESIKRSAVVKALAEAKRPRIIMRWRRPEGAYGWIRGFRILATGADVTDVPNDEAPSETRWLPPPSLAEIACVELVLMEPNKGMVQIDGLTPIAAFGTAGTQSLLVVAGCKVMSPDDLAGIAELRAKLSMSPAQKAADDARDDQSALRALLFCGEDEYGTRIAVDLAV